MQQRQSGLHIAKLLLQTQHESENGKSKLLEAAVSDALRYLGFQVRDLAKPGEPEGVASAYTLPTTSNPTREDPTPPLYKFTFDAKSSKYDAARTGNIKLDGVVVHRTRFNANYALVIAPGFTGDAIGTRCEQQKVTPLTARDLGKLLEYTVEYGAIPVTKLREMFLIYDPNAVSAWISQLKEWLEAQRNLTMNIFLQALENLKGQIPDALSAATIALECRKHPGAVSVKNTDVLALAHGLAILIPDLIGVTGDEIIVNASAERVAAAVNSQLEKLHSDEPLPVESAEGNS